MSWERSTVPEAKKRLKAGLATRIDNADRQVYRAYVPDDAPDTVVVVENAEVTQEHRNLGAKNKREIFRVMVAFQSLDVNDDVESASARVYEMFGELEDLIRDDPSFNRLALVTRIEGFDDQEGPGPSGGVMALVRARVRFECRIGRTAA